ncbi:MAG: rhomboid family intramembrane serine protease, partial [Myxococcota bacterium]
MSAPLSHVSLTRFPRITALLCLVQVLGYLALARGARSLPLDVLVQSGAKVSANVLELGETWRLFTANLLHRDVLHLGFNTFFLFNVGGAVENALRTRDYSLVLIGAALGTTSLSLAMSSVPSVGSSGVVLGLFGSASVVGYKYGDLLPKPYRRYFGGAVLPFALFILYVGFASPDTDNWAHLGGLVVGALVTVPMVPRFAPGPHVGWSLAASAVLVGGVLASGPVLAAAGPPLETFRVRSSGLRVSHPVRWEGGENHLGDLAWGNRLGVTLGFMTGRSEDPVELETLKAEFVEELRVRESEGVLTRVRITGEKPYILPGAPGHEPQG